MYFYLLSVVLLVQIGMSFSGCTKAYFKCPNILNTHSIFTTNMHIYAIIQSVKQVSAHNAYMIQVKSFKTHTHTHRKRSLEFTQKHRRMARLLQADRKAVLTPITTLHKREQKSISEYINLEAERLQQ